MEVLGLSSHLNPEMSKNVPEKPEYEVETIDENLEFLQRKRKRASQTESSDASDDLIDDENQHNSVKRVKLSENTESQNDWKDDQLDEILNTNETENAPVSKPLVSPLSKFDLFDEDDNEDYYSATYREKTLAYLTQTGTKVKKSTIQKETVIGHSAHTVTKTYKRKSKLEHEEFKKDSVTSKLKRELKHFSSPAPTSNLDIAPFLQIIAQRQSNIKLVTADQIGLAVDPEEDEEEEEIDFEESEDEISLEIENDDFEASTPSSNQQTNGSNNNNNINGNNAGQNDDKKSLNGNTPNKMSKIVRKTHKNVIVEEDDQYIDHSSISSSNKEDLSKLMPPPLPFIKNQVKQVIREPQPSLDLASLESQDEFDWNQTNARETDSSIANEPSQITLSLEIESQSSTFNNTNIFDTDNSSNSLKNSSNDAAVANAVSAAALNPLLDSGLHLELSQTLAPESGAIVNFLSEENAQDGHDKIKNQRASSSLSNSLQLSSESTNTSQDQVSNNHDHHIDSKRPGESDTGSASSSKSVNKTEKTGSISQWFSKASNKSKQDTNSQKKNTAQSLPAISMSDILDENAFMGPQDEFGVVIEDETTSSLPTSARTKRLKRTSLVDQFAREDSSEDNGDSVESEDVESNQESDEHNDSEDEGGSSQDQYEEEEDQQDANNNLASDIFDSSDVNIHRSVMMQQDAEREKQEMERVMRMLKRTDRHKRRFERDLHDELNDLEEDLKYQENLRNRRSQRRSLVAANDAKLDSPSQSLSASTSQLPTSKSSAIGLSSSSSILNDLNTKSQPLPFMFDDDEDDDVEMERRRLLEERLQRKKLANDSQFLFQDEGSQDILQMIERSAAQQSQASVTSFHDSPFDEASQDAFSMPAIADGKSTLFSSGSKEHLSKLKANFKASNTQLFSSAILFQKSQDGMDSQSQDGLRSSSSSKKR